MSSRFFAAGESSSESSSEEEELYSEEEKEQKSEDGSQDDSDDSDEEEASSDEEDGGKTGISKFLKDQASSEGESSDDDTPKLVKSAKNKRLEELDGVIKLIDNAVKINDWSSISTGRCLVGEFSCSVTDGGSYRIR